MQDSVYFGWVRHRRFHPVPHQFSYRLCLLMLNTATVSQIFKPFIAWSYQRFNLASFYPTDYWDGQQHDLDQAVRTKIAQETGKTPQGKIFMLTHPRYLGHVFNPVTFYLAISEQNNLPEFIVAEITNTPWRERFHYVLDCSKQAQGKYIFDKQFHISPFMPMQMEYRWEFHFEQRSVKIHMENYIQNEKHFDATMNIHAEELNQANLRRVLISYPLMTIKVISAIYWQAFKLWVKRVRFYPHP